MSFAIKPKAKGDEEKMATSLRRLAEEDPTLMMRRDEQTGEQLLSGLSQMHVEVGVDRLKRRFGVDVELQPPRVPYQESIRKEARAQGKYKKQTGGRGQYGDCHIVLEPIEGHTGYEFVDKIVGGVIPQSYRPAVDKGIQEAMQSGDLAGAPVSGVRVLLVDGSYHNVDSSEMAFKIAGSMAFKQAYEKADPVLLEPIMEVEITVPDEAVGAVNGDLNSRRGRLHGMEPKGGMTTINAEVPMAEILTYAQSLTSMTAGRGDYHMHFLRYEEVPVARRAEGDGGVPQGPRRSEGLGAAESAAHFPRSSAQADLRSDGRRLGLRVLEPADQVGDVGELLLEVALVVLQPLEHALALVEAAPRRPPPRRWRCPCMFTSPRRVVRSVRRCGSRASRSQCDQRSSARRPSSVIS